MTTVGNAPIELLGHNCSPGFSQSSATAPDTKGAVAQVTITHPFHPLSGKQFFLVCKKHNRHGDRIWYESDGGRVESIPAAWTSHATPEPFNVVAGGKAYFRTTDLIALAKLIDHLLPMEKTDREASHV
jgi:hypothetical protein